MMNQIKYWIIILSFLGCSSMKSIVGTYSSNTKNAITNHTLILNIDSTFNYSIKGNLLDQKSTGKWHVLDNGDLVLKSNHSLFVGVIDIVEENRPNEKNFNIQIINEYGDPLSFAAIIINNDLNLGFSLDEKGSGNFEINDLKSVSIYYLGKEYYQVLENPNVNSVTLKVRLQSESFIYLDNEIWKVKGRKLISSSNLILRKKR